MLEGPSTSSTSCDALFADGQDLTSFPLLERKGRLEAILDGAPGSLQFSEHHVGNGELVYAQACKLGIEGIVSKRLECPYKPGDRGVWRKVKCLNREEFVVVGWTDPEGSRPYLGALLLGYRAPDGRLIYAGRAGTGLNTGQLRHLLDKLRPLAVDKMTVDVPPRERAASVRRSSSPAFIGSAPRSSWRSRI